MKVTTITLCFNNPDIVEKSLERYYETRNPDLHFHHVLVDNCYPLPSHDSVQARLGALARRYGAALLRPGKNLGLHEGWNWACSQLQLDPDDVLIGYDPDSYPITPGWDMALVTALHFNKDNAWACLRNDALEIELKTKTYTPGFVNQVRTWTMNSPIVNSICAWKWGFLKVAGGLQEPMNFYGHLESAMWPHLQSQGKKWVVLPDYTESPVLNHQQDTEYRAYKWEHAHTQKWPGDFESFLKAGCPITQGS